jgi:hypothetical protein
MDLATVYQIGGLSLMAGVMFLNQLEKRKVFSKKRLLTIIIVGLMLLTVYWLYLIHRPPLMNNYGIPSVTEDIDKYRFVFFSNPATKNVGIHIYKHDWVGWHSRGGSEIKIENQKVPWVWHSLDSGGIWFGTLETPSIEKVELVDKKGEPIKVVMKEVDHIRFWYSYDRKYTDTDINILGITTEGQIAFDKNNPS